MNFTVSVTTPIDPTISVDQRVILRDVGWSQYEAVLAMRGESSAVRIAYLEGVLELMSPSRDHERLKTKLARIVEAYAEELGIELEGYGSWTLKGKEEKRGAEPDECYSIGIAGDVPDLAIEVIWTSGGLDKLDIYRRLGVREVWVWQHGAISVFALRGDRYDRIKRSELLPPIDLDLVRSLLDAPSQSVAIRELRARLRARG
jgi:Uma2 family endonuclease